MLKSRQVPAADPGQARSGWPGWLLCVCLLIGTPLALSADQDPCPDLTFWYPDEHTNWFVLERELSRLMPLCLGSAEFFALYGAAQLNSGQVSAAMESLERALLTDPDYGAAQIDYAQALFMQGQLFSALDMNRQVLARPDLPEELHTMLERRHAEWQGMTRRSGGEIDLLAGHDSNLNRGPLTNRITVTLSGEPVDLELSPEFLPVSGLYTNLRAAGHYTRFEPGHSHNFLAEINGRISEDSRSDMTQINTRYAWLRPAREHSWQLGGALGHLTLGGSPLFSAAETNARFQVESEQRCAPFYAIAAQYQHFHQGNSHLNTVEARNAGGLHCQDRASDTIFSAELGMLNSFAIEGGRPGGDRVGWQARFDWQRPLFAGVLAAQAGHTRLHDREVYSELLANGSRRDLDRSYAQLQYRQATILGGVLLLNLYHQRQRSNIELFSSDDTAAELGIRFVF